MFFFFFFPLSFFSPIKLTCHLCNKQYFLSWLHFSQADKNSAWRSGLAEDEREPEKLCSRWFFWPAVGTEQKLQRCGPNEHQPRASLCLCKECYTALNVEIVFFWSWPTGVKLSKLLVLTKVDWVLFSVYYYYFADANFNVKYHLSLLKRNSLAISVQLSYLKLC